MIIQGIKDENLTGNGNRVVTAAPGSLTQGLPLTYNSDGNAVPTVIPPHHPANYPLNLPFGDIGFMGINWSAGTSKIAAGELFILQRLDTIPNDFSLYVEPIPAGDYNLWTRLMFNGRLTDASELGGLCWYDENSGAAMIFGQRANGHLFAYVMSQITPTPQFTNLFDNSGTPRYAEQSGALAIGLEGDGSNKRMVFCPSLEHSRTFKSFGAAEHISPTHMGLFVANGVSGGESYLEVLSYAHY